VCTACVPRMYRVCTAYVPRMYRVCTAYVPRVYRVCTACAFVSVRVFSCAAVHRHAPAHAAVRR